MIQHPLIISPTHPTIDYFLLRCEQETFSITSLSKIYVTLAPSNIYHLNLFQFSNSSCLTILQECHRSFYLFPSQEHHQSYVSLPLYLFKRNSPVRWPIQVIFKFMSRNVVKVHWSLKVGRHFWVSSSIFKQVEWNEMIIKSRIVIIEGVQNFALFEGFILTDYSSLITNRIGSSQSFFRQRNLQYEY
jgi:hypothetical protein